MTRKLLEQALDALVDSIYLLQNDYASNWRHGVPSRKAQLDAEKAFLDAHEKAITDILSELAKPAQQERKPVVWLASYMGRSVMEQEFVSTDKNLADENDA